MGKPLIVRRVDLSIEPGVTSVDYFVYGFGFAVTLRFEADHTTLTTYTYGYQSPDIVPGLIAALKAARADAMTGVKSIIHSCERCSSLFGSENALPATYGIPSHLSDRTTWLCAEHNLDRFDLDGNPKIGGVR